MDTISRLLKITHLFWKVSSLLYGSFSQETYHFKEPTDRSHLVVNRRPDKTHFNKTKLYHTQKNNLLLCFTSFSWRDSSNMKIVSFALRNKLQHAWEHTTCVVRLTQQIVFCPTKCVLPITKCSLYHFRTSLAHTPTPPAVDIRLEDNKRVTSRGDT